MRQFVVAGYPKNDCMDLQYRKDDGTRDIFTAPRFGHGGHRVDLGEDPLNRACLVRFCANERSAVALANHLAAMHPDVAWNVAETKFVIQVAVTPPVTARFTEKGLLPE